MIKRQACVLIVALLAAGSAYAKEKKAKTERKPSPVTLSGNLQTDFLVPESDMAIGADTENKTDYANKYVLNNTYLDLNLYSKYVSAGARFEFLKYPLPGYVTEFRGWGVPHVFVTGKYKNMELTVGDFYEQFGSGLILRAYEERSLGIDNSLRGGRFTMTPYNGIRFKLLGGVQRNYWEWTYDQSFVLGGDLELNVDEWLQRWQENNTRLQIGLSYVMKHENDEVIGLTKPESPNMQYYLNLPNNISAFDVRAKFQKNGYSVLAEYAYKINDPSSMNNYTYGDGSVLLLSGSYSQRGMSVLIQAKRSENFNFRSLRSASPTNTAAYLNHLPAFTQQHTYALPALYPYATQPLGEWAFQGEFRYSFKRKTPLGGKYGTDVKLQYSHIRGLHRPGLNATYIGDDGFERRYFAMGTDGPNAEFFKMGALYYQDANIEISKKFTKKFKLSGMYMYQSYNKKVIEGHGDMVDSHIFVLDAKYQHNSNLNFRGEFQYLLKQKEEKSSSKIMSVDNNDEGDWIFGLLEISFLKSFMITGSEMYNFKWGTHYYMAGASYTYKSHRVQVAYARTRAGFNCSGGVCRMVPASKGFQASYTFNF